MRKTILIMAFFILLAIPLLAQDEAFPYELNDAIVTGILTIFGIGLMAIVQFVKNILRKLIPNWENWTSAQRRAVLYPVTLLVSAGATAFTLFQMQLWTLSRFILYTVYTWGYINQFWKGIKEIVERHK